MRLLGVRFSELRTARSLPVGLAACLSFACAFSVPLSAQRGSTVVVAVGSTHSPPIPLGYGWLESDGGSLPDHQRGWLNYYLDAPRNSLLTRATSAVAAVPAALSAGPTDQAMSAVEIPLNAPPGRHALYVRNCASYPIPPDGSCAGEAFRGPALLIGDFDVLPVTVAFKEKRVRYRVTSRSTNGADAQRALRASVPDPTLVIPLGLTAHSAELRLLSHSNGAALELALFPRVGASRVEIRGAMEDPAAVSGRPGLAWNQYEPTSFGFGEHVIQLVSADGDGFSQVGLVFHLTSVEPLRAEKVSASLTAWDANGSRIASDVALDPATFSIR